MASTQHPSLLNPWLQYRQACSILSNTTRSSNPAWYQSALELDLQLHIRPDGPLVFSSYYNRKTSQWSPGPPLTGENLHDQSQFESLAAEIIKHARNIGTSSIGVVLHVADEFATAELNPDLDHSAKLAEIRNAAYNEPVSILEDSSVSPDISSWRVLPYLGEASSTIATTVTITRQFEPLLNTLRNAGERENFPVITRALSAPLEALMGLPQMFKEKPEKPFVTILQYPWFTVLAFFNEHADLCLVRTLQHRGIRRAANFRNALSTTSASLEFLDPDLYIIPLGQDIDESLETTLIANFAHTKVEIIEVPISKRVPQWCPEPLIATSETPEAGILNSTTFSTLRDDGWANQDFLPAAREVSEVFPSKLEMGLLRFSRLLRVAVILLALLGAGYFGFGAFQLSQTEEWKFDTAKNNLEQGNLEQLISERKRIDHWNNLLADRSKAWVVMETIAQMFPKNGGMLIKSCSYTAKPESNSRSTTNGLVKSWKIAGFAREEALEYLNTLNTRDGINAQFNKLAALTGSSAYDMTIGNRNISVNVRTKENGSFRPGSFSEEAIGDESGYPFSFDLTITQRFEATDPLAITSAKAP